MNLEGDIHDSLLMEWNPAPSSQNPGDLSIAAWEYVYGVDPNLTNTKIHFSVGVPGPPLGPPPPVPPIWDISLELLDANGGSGGWFQPGPVIGWSEHWIRPDLLADQGSFLYFEDPVFGFDPTQVIAIRLDEAGTFTTFPLSPGTGSPQFWDWNVWNHLEVAAIPEPSTFVLGLMGLMGLCFVPRRRRRS